MGRPAAGLEINETDRKVLQEFVRTGTKSARSLTRARILLLSGEHQSIASIANMLGVCPATVQNVRRRYREGGLDGALYDQPRSGQPRKVTPRAEAYITTIACSTPPDGQVRWTIRLVTDRLVELYGVELSTEAVRQVLKKVG
ncbi:MAG TPA: helix-turn-helix domain-containing protein [Ardenticatenaceae bacterium]|nr:helix-turn-helix domain-containing protein [Ardenticatenaceae bacterium]